MIARIFKYFDGLHAGGQADGDISKEEWITGFATFIKGDASYSLSSSILRTFIYVTHQIHCHQGATLIKGDHLINFYQLGLFIVSEN